MALAAVFPGGAAKGPAEYLGKIAAAVETAGTAYLGNI